MKSPHFLCMNKGPVFVTYLWVRSPHRFFPMQEINVWLHRNERDHIDFPSLMPPEYCFLLKRPQYWVSWLNKAPYWFLFSDTPTTFFSLWMKPPHWFRFMKCAPILIFIHECGHCTVSLYKWCHCIDLYLEYSCLLILFPHWFIINQATVFISSHNCDHRLIYTRERCHATFFPSE
jgi:hypothetical protein